MDIQTIYEDRAAVMIACRRCTISHDVFDKVKSARAAGWRRIEPKWMAVDHWNYWGTCVICRNHPEEELYRERMRA